MMQLSGLNARPSVYKTGITSTAGRCPVGRIGRGIVFDRGAEFGQGGAEIFLALAAEALLVRAKVGDPGLDLGAHVARDDRSRDLDVDLNVLGRRGRRRRDDFRSAQFLPLRPAQLRRQAPSQGSAWRQHPARCPAACRSPTARMPWSVRSGDRVPLSSPSLTSARKHSTKKPSRKQDICLHVRQPTLEAAKPGTRSPPPLTGEARYAPERYLQSGLRTQCRQTPELTQWLVMGRSQAG